ncbi:MAG: hypothetical protein JXQ75_01080 [Phycisphaerae bacterium]|nr:hypothetical protein [Phycisphaerae bacterium]
MSPKHIPEAEEIVEYFDQLPLAVAPVSPSALLLTEDDLPSIQQVVLPAPVPLPARAAQDLPKVQLVSLLDVSPRVDLQLPSPLMGTAYIKDARIGIEISAPGSIAIDQLGVFSPDRMVPHEYQEQFTATPSRKFDIASYDSAKGCVIVVWIVLGLHARAIGLQVT